MTVSSSRKYEVWARDGWCCHYCGRTPKMSERTVDHVWPVSRGGVDAKWNLVAACYRCNQRWGDEVAKCFCQFCATATGRHRARETKRSRLQRMEEEAAAARSLAELAGWVHDPVSGVWSRAPDHVVSVPLAGVLVGMTEQQPENGDQPDQSTTDVEVPAKEQTSVEVDAESAPEGGDE